MMEILDTDLRIDVDPAEYARLLGYPPGHALDGRAQELADWARDWYSQNGLPWFYARQCDSLSVVPGQIQINGARFSSPRLENTLASAEATGAFIVAVSAGGEAEAKAHELWKQEKPDEYFFLEIYGSAVVEHLVTRAGSRLCAWADQNQLAVLPHYSPGYPEWDITQQPQLLQLIRNGATKPLPAPLEVLHTGMLRPKKSLIGVFGLTPHLERTKQFAGLVPCHHCSFSPCQFRRAPYLRVNTPEAEVAAVSNPAQSKSPLADNPKYSTNVRALERWSRERLTLSHNHDGTIDAIFRYDGTTCSNMGRPLAYHYFVTLGPRDDGYPLREMRCMPVPGDEGHKFMCSYISQRDALLAAIEIEKPLLGQPLGDVLNWSRPATGAGCYCESSSREHKWGLVLETIHFAISQRELTAERVNH